MIIKGRKIEEAYVIWEQDDHDFKMEMKRELIIAVDVLNGMEIEW